MTIPGQRSPGSLDESSARTLVAGDLKSGFLPAYGMLGVSLRHRGVEAGRDRLSFVRERKGTPT
jgi:hypothetical protein